MGARQQFPDRLPFLQVMRNPQGNHPDGPRLPLGVALAAVIVTLMASCGGTETGVSATGGTPGSGGDGSGGSPGTGGSPATGGNPGTGGAATGGAPGAGGATGGAIG